MQRMGISPARCAARTFRLTDSSVSPKYCLRSEWPRMAYFAPDSFTIRGETSPV